MSEMRTFFKYVIPSILSFALSGIYAIVDGFFVGHSVGDMGLSAINVAYPVSAVLQAVGTGIGIGGAVCYSISSAEGREKRARDYTAATLWILLISSVLLTALAFCFNAPILRLLAPRGNCSHWAQNITGSSHWERDCRSSARDWSLLSATTAARSML